MFKNILLPLDGAPLSEQSFRQLPKVADEKAVIYLLQVVSGPDPIITPDSLPITTSTPLQQLQKEALAYLRGKANDLALAGFTTRPIVITGDDPAFRIITFAKQKDIDLIVMSTHGRGGLSKLVFGSVTTDVIRAAPCPVLVVRPS